MGFRLQAHESTCKQFALVGKCEALLTALAETMWVGMEWICFLGQSELHEITTATNNNKNISNNKHPCA